MPKPNGVWHGQQVIYLQWSKLGYALVLFCLVKYSTGNRVFSYISIIQHLILLLSLAGQKRQRSIVYRDIYYFSIKPPECLTSFSLPGKPTPHCDDIKAVYIPRDTDLFIRFSVYLGEKGEEIWFKNHSILNALFSPTCKL